MALIDQEQSVLGGGKVNILDLATVTRDFGKETNPYQSKTNFPFFFRF